MGGGLYDPADGGSTPPTSRGGSLGVRLLSEEDLGWRTWAAAPLRRAHCCEAHRRVFEGVVPLGKPLAC